jgi:D-sedoheptulose 7-phosphate isomerase
LKDITKFLEQERDYIVELWSNPKLMEISRIEAFARKILNGLETGGILAFFGNGGSAAEANHLAAEFVGKCVIDHLPLRAMSFASNNSILTAIANDYGTSETFARQSLALLNENSIAVGLSTSGTSTNVLKGLKAAKSRGAYTVLWTSSKVTEESEFIDEVWRVDSRSTPRIQEVHLLWGHLVAETIEHLISA